MLFRSVSISAPGTATSVTLPAGGIGLGTNVPVYLTGPKPVIVLTKLTHALDNGSTVKITLNFLNAGSVSMTVPVLPRSSDYATFSPAPVPTTPSAKPSTPTTRVNSGATSTATPTSSTTTPSTG